MSQFLPNMASRAEWTILVDEAVKQRLEKCCHLKTDEFCLGYLFGRAAQNQIQVIGCAACRKFKQSPTGDQPGIPDWTVECAELSSIIPTGIHICGICYSSQKPLPANGDTLHRIFEGVNQDAFLMERMLAVWHVPKDGSEATWIVYDKEQKSVTTPGEVQDVAPTALGDCLNFRIQSSVAVSLEYKNDFKQRISMMVERLCEDLNSTSSTFHLQDCNLLIRNGGGLSEGDVTSESCEILPSRAAAVQGDVLSPNSGKVKGKQKGAKNISKDVKVKDVLDVKFLRKISKDRDDEVPEVLVPVLHVEKAAKTHVNFTLSVDVLITVDSSTMLKELPALFIMAVCSQLKKMARLVQETYSEADGICVPKPCHFKLPGFCHFVTAVYPKKNLDDVEDVEEKELRRQRVELHKRLLLPEDRPLFRTVNSYSFDGEGKQEPYLINPHTAISSSAATGDTVVTVEGKYSYHHYMQDSFNDDGWGCAYRSLQTLCSWFRHQGYTRRAAPTHRQIQQALVDLGDKPKSLVGSRQWIGSFEVGLCLEHFLGVTYKILYVNSGAELANKGRELVRHFSTQGTPIMIGGGVLAHTILGVDYNDQTGDIRFLILDPHYTGGEDLKFILDKGWCGWKGPNFWNQQAHYNLCMPQRPCVI